MEDRDVEGSSQIGGMLTRPTFAWGRGETYLIVHQNVQDPSGVVP